MIERPFPCTSDEVRAIRSNLKTQSRSLRGMQKINEDPGAYECFGLLSDNPESRDFGWWAFDGNGALNQVIRCPWGVAGDRLWVQEAFAWIDCWDAGRCHMREDNERLKYRADFEAGKGPDPQDKTALWSTASKMPRSFSRDTLEIVSVRPERIHCITRDDCFAEGIMYNPSVVVQNSRVPALYSHGTTDGFPTAKDAFHDRWDSRHGKTAPWAENKWVWRIEYRRINER